MMCTGLRIGAFALACLVLVGCQVPRRPEPVEPEPLPAPAAPRERKPVSPPTPPPPPPQPTPDLFERLRARLQHQDCEPSAEQQRWVNLYAPRPDRFGQRLAPMLPLLEYVLSRIEAEDLPGEFALIPIIESSYQPQARSSAGPAGLWQFSADTARAFGLKVDAGTDERLAPVEATSAALDLLGGLQQTHGDWVLAAAGFNAGAYRISRLLQRTAPPAAGQLPHGLARGTYDYVGKLKAWACMLGQPHRFGIVLPDPDQVPRLESVRTPARLQRLPLLSEVSGLSGEALRSLNPLLRTQAPARSERELLLPEDAAADLLEFIDRLRRGEVNVPSPPRTYTVRAGDTLSAIAARNGLSVSELARINELKIGGLLRIGQQLRLEP
jgi:membrane-bound lytic murein transglycosylase D